MTPPKLTPDQKEHIRIAQRARLRVEETWGLFNMYLSEDKSPEDALRKAHEAVDVWAEWMDANEVDFPEIEQPTFAQELGDTMQKVFSSLPNVRIPVVPSTSPAHFSIDIAPTGEPNNKTESD